MIRRTMSKRSLLLLLAVVTLTVTVITTGSITTAGDVHYPESYVTERIISEWFPNGTMANEYGEGSVKVFTRDILQEVSLELSGKEGTNLLSTEAYRPSLASPARKPTKLYLNTTATDSRQDLNYDIHLEELDDIPRINITVDYENQKGGKDLHTSTNHFNFNVTIESNKLISETMFEFKSPKETGPMGQDSFDFSEPKCTEGHCTVYDLDNDTYHERVVWTGELNEGEPVNLSFEGETTPGENFQQDAPLRMSDGDYYATYDLGDTHTGIGFVSREGRGNVRSGMYMDEGRDENWVVRGFMKNRASVLEYDVDGWKFYKTGDTEPLMVSNESETIGPGESVYTDIYETEKGDKDMYYTLYDWELIWGDSIYEGFIEPTVRMPDIHQLVTGLDSDISLPRNDISRRDLDVKNKVRNLGDEEVEVENVEIFSDIPYYSEEEDPTSWSIDTGSVSLVYRNYTEDEMDSYDVTDYANITKIEPDETTDGLVHAEINITNSTIDRFRTNDELIMRYTITSDGSEDDMTYTFYSNSKLVSSSGTPDTDQTYKERFVQGAEPEPDPTVPPTEPERIEIDTVESTSSVITGNLVEVKRSDRIIDTGGRGFREVGFDMMLPEGTEIEVPSITIEHRKEDDGWYEISSGNYEVNEKGTSTVGDEKYQIYEIEMLDYGEHGFVLNDEDMVNITYNARLNRGSNEVITRLSGYDYYEDRFVYDEASTSIRVGWKLEELQVVRERWEQDKAAVGQPVRWTRKVSINNPNEETVSRTLEVDLPRESFSCHVNGKDLEIRDRRGNEFVSVDVKLSPMERKVLLLETYTPPVILEDESMEILQSNETSVKFLVENTVHNPSYHRYYEVYRTMDLRKEQVESAIISGQTTDYFMERDMLHIGPMDIPRDGRENISLVYRELPPVLVLSTAAKNFTDPENVEVSVLAVGGEGYKGGNIELSVFGPYPETGRVFSDLIGMPDSSIDRTFKIDMGGLPEGNYTLEANMRRGFQVIETDKTSFWISGDEALLVVETWHVLALMFIIVAVSMPRVYKRKDQYRRRMEKLRKRVGKKL